MDPSKRVFDLALALPGTAVLAPLLGLIAAAIYLEDGGPVFFRQERFGFRGQVFKVWKFRTMAVNAGGEPITLKDDPRVTRVGRILRRYRLDELPQIFNVLAGQMSLVGPRPEVAKYVRLYTAEQRRIFDLLPGVTDPAMIELRAYREQLADAGDLETIYINQIMPRKLAISQAYAARATRWTDLVVLFDTLRVAVTS